MCFRCDIWAPVWLCGPSWTRDIKEIACDVLCLSEMRLSAASMHPSDHAG